MKNARATRQPETGDEHKRRRISLKATANWAAQSVGQDIANLVAFPTLLMLAFAAARGSLRAYLGWIGILAYSVYTYAIYSFDAHFGPLFVVWVGVFGLSIYALIGGLAALDPARVKSRFSGSAPIRFTSMLLVGTGSVFYLLWLSEIIPPLVSGTTPEALREVGLPTKPVHVLDLGVFLPALPVLRGEEGASLSVLEKDPRAEALELWSDSPSAAAVADLLEPGGHPQVILRLGFGPEARPKPRRSAEEVTQAA